MKLGQCRLCRLEKLLVKSHIISEFLYEGIFDEDHKIMILDATNPRVVRTRQSGCWEWLLCEQCDNSFSEIENYCKKLIFGGPDIGIGLAASNENGLLITGVDYVKFKLFQMLTLWRAGIAKDPLFKRVKLGPYEEKLRVKLLKGDPGEPWEYGCIVAIIMTEDGPFDVLRTPDCFCLDGLKHYRFVFGGFIWLYVVAGHAKESQHKHLFLQKNGELRLSRMPLSQLGFLRREFEYFRPHQAAVNKWASRRKGSKV